MDTEGAGKLMWGILGTTIAALAVVAVFSGIEQLGLAPKPGDPYNPLWLSNLNVMNNLLPKLVTGVAAVGAWLIAKS